ncbi:MAG: hypothetical protein ABII06_07210, partial [Pseudomonadota bacterium]
MHYETNQNRYSMIFLGSLLFLLLAQCPASAEKEGDAGGKEILVIGSSIIVDGNVAGARQAATSEALVKGVEAYLARLLGSRGMVNNFNRLINNILPSAKEEV